MTSVLSEVKELIKKLKYKQTATDYVVLSFNWGDNVEYTAHLYPGDIVIRQSGKWVPYCGEQVNQFFDIEYMKISSTKSFVSAFDPL